MKTYVLMVSKFFPAYHPKRGQLTYFAEKIQNDTTIITSRRSTTSEVFEKKVHTIRENYDLWVHRAKEINAGRAVLSLRQWTGKPYRSKQKEFMQLTKIGVQKITIKIVNGKNLFDRHDDRLHPMIMRVELPEIHKIGSAPIAPNVQVPIQRLYFFRELSMNDGLSDDDFIHWFKKDFDGCVIHFTPFRYT